MISLSNKKIQIHIANNQSYRRYNQAFVIGNKKILKPKREKK